MNYPIMSIDADTRAHIGQSDVPQVSLVPILPLNISIGKIKITKPMNTKTEHTLFSNYLQY